MEVCNYQPLAESKGVHREMESEGSFMQISEPGTRISSGISELDEFATQKEVL